MLKLKEKISEPKTPRKKRETNFTSGPMLIPLMLFTLPVLATGVLQFLYNAADTAVVGRFVGKTALAAVGSTGSLSNLITGLFIGLSVGSGVAVSHALGSGEEKDASEIVHTSIAVSLVLGAAVGIAGFFISTPLLHLMSVPDNVISLSSRYIRIIFLGIPAQMVYNYGAAILRARGDTRHPLYFLIISGGVNVGLNLFFVLVCNMSVAGVAYATIISQYLSAVMVTALLCFLPDCCRLDLRKLKIYPGKLLKIIRIGIPAGVQSVLFSFSNVLIQSSVNSLGDIAMAGNTAAANIDGLIYIACNSFYHAALNYTGQNLGARKTDRIRRTCRLCLVMVTIVGLMISGGCWIFRYELLGIYAPGEKEVIEYGTIRLLYMGVPYFLCGAMEVMSGMLRGLGASITSMVVSLMGACVMRIVWIYTVFSIRSTPEVLYISYPISWILTGLCAYVCYRIVLGRTEKRLSEEGS
ncbi:MAG: MATE family efflux transporter [Clostridia bacterium]|nr:MATE family efflux transporter [Clostridia bacterium]